MSMLLTKKSKYMYMYVYFQNKAEIVHFIYEHLLFRTLKQA